MQFFLNDLIHTLTKRSSERVGDLLHETLVSKDQIQTIAERLSSMQDFTPLVLSSELPFGRISGSSIKQNLRDTSIRLAEMYRISDLISLVLDGQNAVLHAEIQSLEQELNSLEKMADNYAFLLSDGSAFNFAYLEPFNDEIGRDSFTFNISDRAAQTFTILDQAIVSPDEGVLALTGGIKQTQSAQGSILAANASAFVVSDTGIHSALDPSSGTGWVYKLRSPNPITSSLPHITVSGAQVQLEFVLGAPAPLSEIRLAPIAGNIEQVVQVTLFPDPANAKGVASRDLLTDPLSLDRVIVLRFPLQSVWKVRVVLNQPTYERNIQTVNVPETTNSQLWNNMRARSRTPAKTLFPTLHFVMQGSAPIVWKYTPLPNTDVKWGPLRLDRIISNINSFLSQGVDNAWTQQDPQSSQLMNQVFALYPEWASSLSNRSVFQAGQFDPRSQSTQYQWPSSVQPVVTQSPSSFVVSSVSADYEYTLGLQNIAFGVDTPNLKGVFASVPMAITEQVSVVRLKTSEQNYVATNQDWDSNVVTSVEYSVSPISNPNDEVDWIPIMSVDQTQVFAERFFPDMSGTGFLRFPASVQEPIKLYKNHILYNLIVPQYIVYSSDKQSIVGLRIPLDSYTARDIFTIDYTPASDQSTINFNALGYDQLPLIASHDNDGAGEGFSVTGDRNTAVLSASPYIDYLQVKISTYSPTAGLAPYVPVRVILEDGTVPINLTNYIPAGPQTTLPDPTVDGYYYLHSDSTLIFNKPITQSFRVYYQYLQNTVRVRVVLRVNDTTFVSPKVDFFHLKAMTRRPNALNL